MLILILMFLALPAIACDKGCFEYQGNCACDSMPERAPDVQPSDENPPSDKMPSYQREGVHADMPLPVPAETKYAKSEDMSNMLPNGGVPVR